MLTDTTPAIQLKTFEEARATLAREFAVDRGFLRPRQHVLLVALVLIALLTIPWAALLAVMLWLADFVVHVRRRRALLREFATGQPRLENEADLKALLDSYRSAGQVEQDMTEYAEAAGLSAHDEWRKDLRYHEVIARIREHAPVATIIDVGAGDGRLAWRYGAGDLCSRYVGLDVSTALLGELRRRLPHSVVAVADCTWGLPVPRESADVIVCTEAFEHLARPAYALFGFVDVLKPGGWIIIQSPNAGQLRNLNPIHVLQCVLGLWLPIVLQPIVVHENTWARAYTYHWEFSLRWFRQQATRAGLGIRAVHCATYRFNPAGGRVHRLCYWAFRNVWPLTRLGWDMTIVLEKR